MREKESSKIESSSSQPKRESGCEVETCPVKDSLLELERFPLTSCRLTASPRESLSVPYRLAQRMNPKGKRYVPNLLILSPATRQ
jgi:hypothetical protein